jgi:hypothetical protein
MSVITVINTADLVNKTMDAFCSCATPWFRKASVSARSVAVLLLRSCKKSAVRMKVRVYLLALSKRDSICNWVASVTQAVKVNDLPRTWSPSAISSKLVRIGRSGINRLSKNLTFPSVSWLTRSGSLIIVEVVVSAYSWLAPTSYLAGLQLLTNGSKRFSYSAI